MEYKISVIVLSYNPKWEKIAATLRSVIFQKGVPFQVVVADDGSSNNNFDKIEKLFLDNGFVDYKLVGNKENRGTINNLISALAVCDGEYVKPIGQGDLLLFDDILRKYVDCFENSNADLVAANMVYYYTPDNKVSIYSYLARPQVFSEKDVKKRYLVYNDIANGATIAYRKNPFMNYLESSKKTIKFSEDMVAKVMVYDDFVMSFIDEDAILYESDSGISTTKDNGFSKRLLNEFKASYDIMLETSCGYEKLLLTAVCAYHMNPSVLNKVKLCLLCPSWLLDKIRMKVNPKMTEENVDTSFIMSCFEVNE